MSDQLDRFSERANDAVSLLVAAKRYLNDIDIKPQPGVDLLVQIRLPSHADNGILAYKDYLEKNNGEKAPKVKVIEAPLEETIQEINIFLKKPLALLMEIALEMGHWIRLKIPKVEDGNNIGVRIQETILTDIDRFKELLLTVEKYQDGYSGSRAEILTSICNIKRPNKNCTESLNSCLGVIDFDHFHQFRIHILEVELEVEFVFDRCKKNLEKLMNPNDKTALNSMF